MPFIGDDVRVKPDTAGDAVKKPFFHISLQKPKKEKKIIFCFIKILYYNYLLFL